MQIYGQLVMAMLFYGVSFVSTKIALGAYGPVTVLAIRLILSSVFLVVLDRLIPVRAKGGKAGAAGGSNEIHLHALGYRQGDALSAHP